jgi:hypothetical protein
MEADTQERQKAWSRYSRAGDDNSGVHRTSLIKQQASISWFQEWQIWSAHYLLQHRTEQSQTLVMRYFQWLSHIELLRACYYLYRTRIWLTNGATGPIPGDAPEERRDPFQGRRQSRVGILCLTIILLILFKQRISRYTTFVNSEPCAECELHLDVPSR